MGCKDCGNKKAYTMMPCKVCELLDGDGSSKLVTYCDFCKAYICKKDTFDLIRRARAFLKA